MREPRRSAELTRGWQVRALHLAVAIGGWLLLGQALSTDGFLVRAPDPRVAEVFRSAALMTSAIASVALIWAGRTMWRPGVALAWDLASVTAAIWVLGVMWLGPWTLELAGFFLVIIIAARMAAPVWAVFSGGGVAHAGLAALGVYAGLALWTSQWSTAEGALRAAVVILAAWTSLQVLLIARDLFPGRPGATAAWALASFLAPLPVLTAHSHPAVAGAALLATAYRIGVTGPLRLPAPAVVLVAAALIVGATTGSPFAPDSGVALLPQRALAIFFDRSLGILATAPWLLIGAAAVPLALRDRRVAISAVAVVTGAIFVLFDRSWEGTALPAYMTIASLPLWGVMVAGGLVALRDWYGQLAAAAVVVLSAVATFALAADPSVALTSFGDGRLRLVMERLLGIDPLGWLPNVERFPDRELGGIAIALALVGLFAVAAYPRRRR